MSKNGEMLDPEASGPAETAPEAQPSELESVGGGSTEGEAVGRKESAGLPPDQALTQPPVQNSGAESDPVESSSGPAPEEPPRNTEVNEESRSGGGVNGKLALVAGACLMLGLLGGRMFASGPGSPLLRIKLPARTGLMVGERCSTGKRR